MRHVTISTETEHGDDDFDHSLVEITSHMVEHASDEVGDGR